MRDEASNENKPAKYHIQTANVTGFQRGNSSGPHLCSLGCKLHAQMQYDTAAAAVVVLSPSLPAPCCHCCRRHRSCRYIAAARDQGATAPTRQQAKLASQQQVMFQAVTDKMQYICVHPSAKSVNSNLCADLPTNRRRFHISCIERGEKIDRA